MLSGSEQWVTEQLGYNLAVNTVGITQPFFCRTGWEEFWDLLEEFKREYTLLSSWFYPCKHEYSFPNSCPDLSIIWLWAQCKGRQKQHEMEYCFLVTAEAHALGEMILLPLAGKRVWASRNPKNLPSTQTATSLSLELWLRIREEKKQ